MKYNHNILFMPTVIWSLKHVYIIYQSKMFDDLGTYI